MSKQEKVSSPPLVSYTSFISFLNQLREHGTVPSRIDKSLMPKASGSQSAATLSALKYFSLIDDVGKPAPAFDELVLANDDARKPMLEKLVRASYPFLFSEFDLEKATSGEMAEKFRAQEISGGSLTKSISFFLAAAKEAGIRVSALIKAPPAPKTNGANRKPNKAKVEDQHNTEDEEEEEDDPDTERFEIPIPGKSSVKVIVPNDLDADDWEMLQSMITVYIKRWKGFKDKKDTE